MSSEDVAISVKNLSKHYLMFAQPQDRLKQMFYPKIQRTLFMQPKKYYKDFAAVTDVSFDIKRGETVGIIGRNGSGKSTLLQLICGTLQSSAGSIAVNGRIAALLELGAGFNPEFTGRENVYMNAAILGASRSEVDERFSSIATFAGIGDFIEQPVKTYSSGMYIRLAFAVAINVDPDILIIDEALSVGDEAFQRKCFARIEDIKRQGSTILFVSHSAGSITQLCDKALLMDRGELLLEGYPKTVVSQYQKFINLSGEEADKARDTIRALNGWAAEPVNDEEAVVSSDAETHTTANEGWYDPSLEAHSRVEYEENGAIISDVRITTLDGERVNVIKSGDRYLYRYSVSFSKNVDRVGFGMMIKTPLGLELGGAATDFEKKLRLDRAKAGSFYEVCFELTWSLAPGNYFLNAGVTGSISGSEGIYSHRLLDAYMFRVLPLDYHVATGHINFDVQPSYKLISD